MEYHEIAAVFPMMSGEEFDDLKNDIKVNGLKQPIVIYEGKVLDGRNRHKACTELGIKCKSGEYTGDDPVSHVISLNLRRRQLTTSQRAVVAAKIARLPVGNTPNSQKQLFSQKQAAKSLGIAVSTLKSAKKVLEYGTEEEIKAAEKGEAAVTALEEKVVERARKETPEKAPAKRTVLKANSNKKLMEKGLTAIEGTCIGLTKLDWEMVKSSCAEEEKKHWGGLAATLSTNLRKYSKILKGGDENADKD